MSASAAAAASAIAVQRDKVIQHFVELNATSAECAIPEESLPAEALALLDDLKRAGVLRVTGSGTLYADLPREGELRSARRSLTRKLLLAAAFLALAMAAVVALRAPV